MLAIAIRSQVRNFPFFGQSPTTRDTLVNGVLTSTSERWSDSQNSTWWATTAALNNISFTVYSGYLPQGIALNNCYAAMFTPIQMAIGWHGKQHKLDSCLGQSMSHHDTFNKFFI